VAHEVLQMKPIINKDYTYEKFLEANDWVFKIFPNSKSNIKYQTSKLHIKNQNSFKLFKFLIVPLRIGGQVFHFSFFIFNFFGIIVESILKIFQLTLINRHKTKEMVTSTQLWFHPQDFYKRIHGLTINTDKYG